jgi:hypothetical protein
MKIKLHTLSAGPLGVLHPGVHDVKDKEGRQLIDGGYAVEVGKPDLPVSPSPTVQTAVFRPTETATAGPAKKMTKKSSPPPQETPTA